MIKQVLEIRGKQISVEKKIDSAKRAYVFMHGLNSSIRLNDKLLFPDWKKVTSKYPLVRFDVIGHGSSQICHEPDRFTWSSLSQDLQLILNELNLEEVVLAGSSMGAATCLYAALNSNNSNINIKALVLAIPPTHGDDRMRLSKLYEKFATILEQKGVNALIDHWRSLPPTKFFEREYPESREISFQDFAENGDALSLAAAFRGSIENQYPSSDELSCIDHPTLIFSRVDDPVHPVESAEYLSTQISSAKHIRANTKEDVFAWPEIVNQFLDEL